MNILVITYWSSNDALIRAYTLPYLEIIQQLLPEDSRIYLFTLEKDRSPAGQSQRERMRAELLQKDIHLTAGKYFPFGIKAIANWIVNIVRLKRLCGKHEITSIHTWCMPAGTIGYLLSRWTGISLIVDSYEPHADAMIENGTWKRRGLAYSILSYYEKKLSRHARAVIGLTSQTKAYAQEKYRVQLKRFYVKPACVDLHLFNPQTTEYPDDFVHEHQLKDKLICVYSGKFGGIYLEREIFDFFKVCSDYWGEKFIALILSESNREQLEKLAIQSAFDLNQCIHLFVPHRDIPKYLSIADFALNPVKPVPSKRYCTSVKDGEYWAMGLPVVITSNISDDSDLIENTRSGAVLKRLDPSHYEKAVAEINDMIVNERREIRTERIRKLAIKYRNFDIARKVYASIYQNKG